VDIVQDIVDFCEGYEESGGNLKLGSCFVTEIVEFIYKNI
jgi:hypothetical protein